MALNLESLSLTSVFNSLVNYFQSQDNSSKVSDLSNSSEGSFLLRLLSNVVSNLSYKLVSQCRENFLSTAALQSSTTGIAVNLGYSVYRGENLKRKIKVIPDSDYTLPKLTKVGDYTEDYGIYTLDEVVLERGNAVEINVVIGAVKEETFVTGTSDVKCFSLFTEGISEDFALYLGSMEVPTTKVIKEMTEDKYLVRTNPYNSVDIMYLNGNSGAKYTYGTGSELTLRYIKLEDIEELDLSNNMFDYGELVDFSVISSYSPFETVDETKVKAPLDHETQNIIRSKVDYANRVSQLVSSILEVNWKPLSPTFTQVTYVKDDLTLISEKEKEGIKEVIEKERFFGTPLLDLVHPVREVSKLKVSVAVTNKYKNVSDIDIDVSNILSSSYAKQLGVSFNIYDIERMIENLSYVRYARVSVDVFDRKPGVTYQMGHIAEKDGNYYVVKKILGTSGPMTPNWNLPLSAPSEIDTNMETVDGSVVWRAYKKLPNLRDTITERENNSKYGIGDIVLDSKFPNYMFKCVDLKKKSGSKDPGDPLLTKGDFILDNGIVWVIIDRSSYDTWSSSTSYSLGSRVNFPSSPNVSAECVSYTGVSDTSNSIKFELPVYDVIDQTSTYFVVSGNVTQFFKENDIIEAVDSEGNKSTFSVDRVVSIQSNMSTQIFTKQVITSEIPFINLKVSEKGTIDGQLQWSLVDTLDDINYGWNSYSVFDHSVEIIG